MSGLGVLIGEWARGVLLGEWARGVLMDEWARGPCWVSGCVGLLDEWAREPCWVSGLGKPGERAVCVCRLNTVVVVDSVIPR